MITIEHTRMRDPDEPTRLEQAAVEQYERVSANHWLAKVWRYLTGRSCRLLDLAAVAQGPSTCARCSVGFRTVAIRQIRGSEGRCHDFDVDFRPLQARTRDRWVRIAVAWQRGVTLPPVALIQIGDTYFVRDGHHRISVAKAMGQPDIEAVVTVWQVESAVPSQPLVASPYVQRAAAWDDTITMENVYAQHM